MTCISHREDRFHLKSHRHRCSTLASTEPTTHPVLCIARGDSYGRGVQGVERCHVLCLDVHRHRLLLQLQDELVFMQAAVAT